MPAQKRQHYVPKCYFKPFSANNQGGCINLFNISRSKPIKNAPVKGQCAESYFYGSDQHRFIENWLKTHEDEYTKILVKTLRHETLTQRDIDKLIDFAYLQYSRTAMAIKRRQDFAEKQLSAIYNGRPMEPPAIDLSDEAIIISSILGYMETRDHISDLKGCVIDNRTKLDFITSDDPVVFTNRYYAQRLSTNNFGVGSSGACFFMPLSPRLLLLCYDGGVYHIGDQQNFRVTITKDKDAYALNELQYLKAGKNIYFYRWNDAARIAAEFTRISHKRPKDWFELSVMVPDEETCDGMYYRPARDGEKHAHHTLVASSAMHPVPSRWLSKLNYRLLPVMYSNGSAMGYVRKYVWEKNGGDRSGLIKGRPKPLPARKRLFVAGRRSET